MFSEQLFKQTAFSDISGHGMPSVTQAPMVTGTALVTEATLSFREISQRPEKVDLSKIGPQGVAEIELAVR